MMNKSARIFRIQKFSSADGPGIRTTVFFKGCNLRCKWCHNPESQRFETEMMFHEKKCTDCGMCRKVCTRGDMHCTLCGTCASYCQSGARELVGREMTADELMREVLMDRMFYETSGGGVTCSGGECMLQIDALTEFLSRCRAENLHTAVDTAGLVPWSSFENIIPYTNLFLYDIKCVTPHLHYEGTERENQTVLENLVRLSSKTDTDIIVRIPVIDGWNANDEEMRKIAQFLAPLRLRQVELLPYHSMGNYKYSALKREAVQYGTPTEDQMAHFRSFFS